MQASEIAHTLRRIDSLAHLPDAWRLYRGITTGRYQSAFRSCDGAEWEFHDDLRWRVQRASPEIRASVPALADSTARDSTRSQRDSTIYEVEALGELTPVQEADQARSEASAR